MTVYIHSTIDNRVVAYQNSEGKENTLQLQLQNEWKASLQQGWHYFHIEQQVHIAN